MYVCMYVYHLLKLLSRVYFILTFNFVVCAELGCTIYHRMVGTAIGTSFCVVYPAILMICLMMNKYSHGIRTKCKALHNLDKDALHFSIYFPKLSV